MYNADNKIPVHRLNAYNADNKIPVHKHKVQLR